MNLIDTHAHLYLKQFENDRSKVIEDAIKNGVKSILLPNIEKKTTVSMLNLCNKYPNNCFPMIGVHPCSINDKNLEEELSHVELELKKKKYIAVGEIGIDLYWEKKYLDVQKKAFAYQINLAKQYNLPIAIHVRDSFNEAIEIVEELNDDMLKGVFHCFSGTKNDAKRIINLGNFYLGIGGVVTFKNTKLENTLNSVKLENILLETDAPYLTPEPYRGQRNESKHILDIAKKISNIYGEKLEKIANISTANAKRLFDIK